MILPDQPNFKSHFAELLHHAASKVASPDLTTRIELARTKQAKHGDYSCNLAMQLAKPLHKNPREIATLLIDALPPSPIWKKPRSQALDLSICFFKFPLNNNSRIMY